MPGISGGCPAFVEDWDEDAHTTISSSRATANIALKKKHYDGSDSGYSSRAGTVASEPIGLEKMSGLRIDTAVLERERQPYHMAPQTKPVTRRELFNQPTGTSIEPYSAREPPFVHQQGICTTCDQYGYHFEPTELPRSSSMAPNPISSRPPKSSGTRNVYESLQNDAKLRRSVSVHAQRPSPIYTPSAAQLPIYTYATAVTPTYSPVFYSYSATPVSAVPPYPEYSPTQTFFDHRLQQPVRPPNPTRRSSNYGEPVIKHAHKDDGSRALERTVSNAAPRPSVTTHRSTRNVEQDRIAMPPPERPVKRSESDAIRRPSIRKSATYDTAVIDSRQPKQVNAADRDVRNEGKQPTIHPTQRGPPPSSYRGPVNAEQPKRPSTHRQSVSYTDGISATKVVGSTPQGQPLSRRTTVPTTSHEQKELDAEAYQRERSKMTSKELATEKLMELKSKKQSSKSETGSSYSHKSHQSSSKDSSGRARSQASGHRTSIILNSGVKLEIPEGYSDNGRPLSINVEGLTISLNTQDEKRKDQKLLERAPSTASRASKRSVANGSVVSSTKSKEKDGRPSNTSRRPSRQDERPSVSANTTGHYRSRTSSSVRGSIDRSRNDTGTKYKYDHDNRVDYADYGA